MPINIHSKKRFLRMHEGTGCTVQFKKIPWTDFLDRFSQSPTVNRFDKVNEIGSSAPVNPSRTTCPIHFRKQEIRKVTKEQLSYENIRFS